MARRASARLRAKSTTPQAQRVSDAALHTPLTAPKLSAVDEEQQPTPSPTRVAQTPRHGTPIQPSEQEMHPQKYQMSTAKPLDEARWLGFSNKTTQQTPTKTHNVLDGAPDFKFTFHRPSLGLSPQARALMEETKGEAAKIRSEMQATQAGQVSAHDVLGRKMATPSGKIGRFSDVHMKAFKKMDSIADHPSAFRSLDTDKASTLKRSPSKAELLERPSSSSSSASLSRPEAGPAKRVKRASEDDAVQPAATPKAALKSALKKPQTTPHTIKPRSILKSAKSARRTTMIPTSQRSPVRLNMTSASMQQEQTRHAQLLSRSPIKSPVKSTTAERIAQYEPESPLLSRSPTKPASPKKSQVDAESPDASSKIPFLARSPTKLPSTATTYGIDDKNNSNDKSSKTPLLARSPAKLPSFSTTAPQQKTPPKGSLFTRFNLLRKSPVKSILRTPQRLYSDDPFKLANGTHLSTPPNPTSDAQKTGPPPAPKTCPVIKHVDFSASTKAMDTADDAPDTPTKVSSPPTSITYPTLPTNTTADDDAESRPNKSSRRMTMAGTGNDFTFRAGAHAITFAPLPRRTTLHEVKPSIRSVEASPKHASITGTKRKADDTTTAVFTSDKENNHDDKHDSDQRPAKKARSNNSIESSRPAATPVATKTPSKKIPTVGVRPKSSSSSSSKQQPKDKRSAPTKLSASRLAMLATPKRRL